MAPSKRPRQNAGKSVRPPPTYPNSLHHALLSQIPGQEPASADEHTRKRKRPRQLCEPCRRRKAKCDRTRPHCKMCEEAGLVSKCVYDERPWETEQKIEQITRQNAELMLNNRKLMSSQTGLIEQIRRMEARLATAGLQMPPSEPAMHYPPLEDTLRPSSIVSGSSSSLTPNLSPAASPCMPSRTPLQWDPALRSEDMAAKSFPSVAREEEFTIDLLGRFELLVTDSNNLTTYFGATSYVLMFENDLLFKSFYSRLVRHSASDKQGAPECQLLAHTALLAGSGADDYLEGDERPPVMMLFIHNSDGATKPILGGKMQRYISLFNKVLPPHDVLSFYITRFFTHAYQFAPFLDRGQFEADCRKHLRPDPNDMLRVVLLVDSPYELAWVATLLVVLRFSHQLLPPRDTLAQVLSSRDSLVQMLRQYDVLEEEFAMLRGPEMAGVFQLFLRFVSKALNLAGAWQLVLFTGIQAVTMVLLYAVYLPLGADDLSVETLVMLLMLVQMARIHALNRDPSKHPNMRCARMRHAWRKIWYHIMYLDCMLALNFGQRLIIDENSYDTRLPTMDEYRLYDHQSGSEASSRRNLMNSDLSTVLQWMYEHEPQVCAYFEQQFKVMQLMRRIIHLCTLFEGRPTRAEFEAVLRDVDRHLDNDMMTLDEMVLVKHDGSAKGAAGYDMMARARMFLLKCDLVYVLHKLLHVLALLCELKQGSGCRPGEEALQIDYYTQCSEKALLLFQWGSKFLRKNAKPHKPFGGVFHLWLRTLMGPPIIGNCLRALPVVCPISIHNKCPTRFDLGRQLAKFSSKDLRALVDWLGFDHTSGTGGKNTTKLFTHLADMFRDSKMHSHRFYQCVKLCTWISMYLRFMKDTSQGERPVESLPHESFPNQSLECGYVLPGDLTRSLGPSPFEYPQGTPELLVLLFPPLGSFMEEGDMWPFMLDEINDFDLMSSGMLEPDGGVLLRLFFSGLSSIQQRVEDPHDAPSPEIEGVFEPNPSVGFKFMDLYGE